MSNFITNSDYEAQIKASNLDAMLTDNPAAIETAEAEAISMVRTYLVELYDTDYIFSQTGSNRHAHLLRLCKSIVLYILHQRLPKRMVPEHIQTDYAEAITFLEKVCDGKIGLDLPRRQGDDNIKRTRFRWGSSPARKY